LRLFSFGGYGLALAALALVVFGAYDSYPLVGVSPSAPLGLSGVGTYKADCVCQRVESARALLHSGWCGARGWRAAPIWRMDGWQWGSDGGGLHSTFAGAEELPRDDPVSASCLRATYHYSRRTALLGTECGTSEQREKIVSRNSAVNADSQAGRPTAKGTSFQPLNIQKVPSCVFCAEGYVATTKRQG